MKGIWGIGLLLIGLLALGAGPIPDAKPWNWEWEDDGAFLKQVLSKSSALFGGNPDSLAIHDVQIIFTRIDRDASQRPQFQHFHLNESEDHWFAPASLVKLPTSLAALEKLEYYSDFGVHWESRMETGVGFSCQTGRRIDTSAVSGFPSIAQDVRKIYLVSDNESYSRLYEWVGPCQLNERLREMGFPLARIVRRFAPCSFPENKVTNPIIFRDDAGRVLMRQPVMVCGEAFSAPLGPILKGEMHENSEGNIVAGPMDFGFRNFVPLRNLHQMVVGLIFPASVPPSQRFSLNAENRRFLLQSMCGFPSDSRFPTYDPKKFPDGYAKYFFFPKEKDARPQTIKTWGKVGQSFGYMSEVAYVADMENGVEFFLSAAIYANANKTMNDGKYEYETVARPFLGELAKEIYQIELARPKSVKPIISVW